MFEMAIVVVLMMIVSCREVKSLRVVGWNESLRIAEIPSGEEASSFWCDHGC